MANMPFSYSVDPQFRSPGLLTPPHPQPQPQPQGHSGGGTDRDRILASAVLLVHNICDPMLRERALTDLSKKREIFYDLAPILWESFGTITALLKEVVSIYPLISPPTLSSQSSTRICNALALLQCVASHPDTKIPFLNAHIPLYLYPFLNTTIKSRPFEYLRLTSLGVIGALVKIDDADAVRFLLHTEIVPLCLRTMENGTELSRTVATFIIEKILVDELGLRYVSTKADRFYAVTHILRAMVESPTDKLSARLLKHIIRCYLRLTEDERSQGCVVLHEILPTMFRDGSVEKYFRDDPVTRYYLQQLLVNVYGDVRVYGFEGGIDRLSEL